MRVAFLIILFIAFVIACARQGLEAFSLPASQTLKAAPTAQIQEPPPTPRPTPAEDTARYVAWMNKQGRPVTDKPREDVLLRVGDWGFFYHDGDPRSWRPRLDRVALDRSGHAVTEAENGDWYALLSTVGLDAAGALKRVAWLFNAEGIDPTNVSRNKRGERITAPTLTSKDGVVTFQGWWQSYTDSPYRRRISITATAASTKLVIEAAKSSSLTKEDLSKWQTVFLREKGIKFKLPPDWRHDGLDLKAGDETGVVEAVDWTAPNKDLVRILVTTFRKEFNFFGENIATSEEMLDEKFNLVTRIAKNDSSYSEVKRLKINNVEGVFRILKTDFKDTDLGVREGVTWSGYRIYRGKAQAIDITLSARPEREKLLRTIFSTLELVQR